MHAPLQGERAGVQTVVGEPFPQRHDRDDDLVADCAGCWLGGSRAGIDGLKTALAVALEPPV